MLKPIHNFVACTRRNGSAADQAGSLGSYHHGPAPITGGVLLDSAAAAAIVEQITGNQERCLQVLFFLDALTEQPDMADLATESQAS